MADAPTIYLTNAASRRPPHRGPGRVWTIMAAPRPRYGESGEGAVRSLVPPLHWVKAALSGEMPMEGYRARYLDALDVDRGNLRPGRLIALNDEDAIAVADGDTLICACSRERAARGECHRVWAAEALARAGWDVVLDGVRRG